MNDTNSYQKLLSNIVLFSMSTFGSKILLFLLTPFYTHILSEAEYGTADLLLQTAHLFIPLTSAGILHAVMRFGLEKNADKKAVFTTGLCVVLLGGLLLNAALPLLKRAGMSASYCICLMLYVLLANVHALNATFVQALGKVRFYAADGILCTGVAIGCQVGLLAVFDLGVEGYLLSSVIADGVSAAVLFLGARLWRYISPSRMQGSLLQRMLQYCLPLIPATACFWIMQASGRYFIAYLIGSTATGLYAVANKICSILRIASGIFGSAWQLSALTDRGKQEKERFFSNVFSVYAAGILLFASLLSLFAPYLMRFLAAPEYYEAWRVTPVLLLSSAIACLGSFFSSIYMVQKRSMAALLIALSGAFVTLLANLLFIPRWGILGAAAANCAGQLTLFLFRAIHSRSLLSIRLGAARLTGSLVLLSMQCLLLESGETAGACLCCAGIALLQLGPLHKGLQSGLYQTKRRRV